MLFTAARLRRRPRRRSPPCWRATRAIAVPRARALHARLVAVQAGPARGRAAVVLRRARPQDRRREGRRGRPRDAAGPDARRPRAGRGHLPRHQHQPREPARAPSRSRRTSTSPTRHELRVPRLPAARRALHQAGARQGRGRHLRRVRPQPAAARAGAGAAGARDRDLRRRPASPTLALDAKKEYVARYGVDSEFRTRQPRGLGARRSRWSRPTSPSWRATTTPARRRPRPAPTTRRRCAGTASYLDSFPQRPGRRRRTTSCWPSCCSRTRASPRPRAEYEKAAYGYPRACQERRRRLRRAARLRAAARSAAAPAEVPALQRASVDSALRFAKAFPQRPARRPGADQRRREAVRAAATARSAAVVAQRVLDAAAAGAPTRSAASPGPCSRTPRSRQGAFDRRREAATPRCWR